MQTLIIQLISTHYHKQISELKKNVQMNKLH